MLSLTLSSKAERLAQWEAMIYFPLFMWAYRSSEQTQSVGWERLSDPFQASLIFVLSKIQLYNRKGCGFFLFHYYVLTEIISESGQEEVNIHRSCTFFLSVIDGLPKKLIKWIHGYHTAFSLQEFGFLFKKRTAFKESCTNTKRS